MNRQDHLNECNDKVNTLKERIEVCNERCSRVFNNYIADRDWEKAIRELDQMKTDHNDYMYLNPNDVAVQLNMVYDFYSAQINRINQELVWINRVSE